MGWTVSDSVDEFLAAAGGLLEARPAENTVLLTVCERIRDAGATAFGSEPAQFGWWSERDGGDVAGAFLRTPPHPVRLTEMPARAAAELAEVLAGSTRGIGGPQSAVDAFLEAWERTTGGTATRRLDQRLYRLGELVMPSVPGAARRAGQDDRVMLLRWFEEFFAELDGVHGDVAAAVDYRLDGGGVQLWEDGGEPVAMAAATTVSAGMARIGPVYTPPHRRRRGYGSAATAAASADALTRGAEQVVLYADVANPTSNSIYRKLGFRPIADDLTVDLHPPISTTGG